MELSLNFIASKYKEYNKIRELLSRQIAVPSSPKPVQRRRKDGHATRTPSKRNKNQAATPPKAQMAESQDAQLSPTAITPVVKPLMLGPTPQKDGKFLGIFDILHSGTTNERKRTALEDLQNNIVATPSKFKKHQTGLDVEIIAKGSRTPASSGERFLLDSLVTPVKRKRGEDGTPSSSRSLFDTPSFLRRDNPVLAPVIEGAASPEAPRPLRSKPFGRSLSNIIDELRRKEDESKSAYDDDLDAMRELEEAESGRPDVPKVIVEDSHADVTLDVDGFVSSDFEDVIESAPEMKANDALCKPWKKKGLKRQTKRVIMRPVKKQQHSVSRSQGSDNGGAKIVTDSQHSQAGECTEANQGDDTASDFNDWSENSEPEAASKLKPDKTESEKEPEQRKRRKTSATAHANFRKLKIKNKNSKAKGHGRFRSRR